MKVLVVDDSSVFRTQIKSALRQADFEIVGACANGKDAIDFLQGNKVDVMTLDLEMPTMNGIETLQEIKKQNLDVKVIVFAANTTRGAQTTLKALSLGALDVVAKPNVQGGTLADSVKMITEDLIPKIRQFGDKTQNKEPILTPVTPKPRPVESINKPSASSPIKGSSSWPKKILTVFRPEIIVVGSSTGGPVALENFFKGMPKPEMPIVVVQHMPPVFTKTLAARLQDITDIPCAEAQNGEPLKPHKIYIAPGDFHLEIYLNKGVPHLILKKGAKRCSVRPSVDYLFETAADVYGRETMGFILTGMGEDGKDGCLAVKNKGGGVMIQDKESSVVWGMPGAVHGTGAFDRMGSIEECRLQLIDILKRQRAA